MAEIAGPRTVLTKALATGIDGTLAMQWRMKSGRTFQEIISDLALSIGAFNEQRIARWGWCLGLTDDDLFEYEDGGSVSEAREITDTDKVDAEHGTTIGHMIELHVYGEAVGGTKRAMRDLRESQFMADVRTLVRKLEWRWERQLLRRWFINTETAIGAAGYNVPFVRGTGGNVDFAPPSFGGEAFTTSHDHYIAVDSDSEGFDVLLDEMAETLQEHGHEPPFTAIVSRADVASYMALTKFVEIVDPVIRLIDRGAESSGNQMFAAGQREFGALGFYQGDYGLIEVKYTNRLTTGYAGLTKSYGSNDPRNGLAVRVHPDVGFGARVVPETTDDAQYPIKQVNVEDEYGVGVGMDRTNGVAGLRIADNTWANSTIG